MVLAQSGITTERVLRLYDAFAADLVAVRARQMELLRRKNTYPIRLLRKWGLLRATLNPQLDRIEAEVTYLLIRETRPRKVVEFSPCGGWSSSWILNALIDNGDGGQLWSFDLTDQATKVLPESLTRGRWHFIQGDVKEHLDDFPPEFEYLFIDSDHSRPFAEWYIGALFPRIQAGTVVSVHDVFHKKNPSAEGEAVIAWLEGRDLSYWTAAPNRDLATFQIVQEKKTELGIYDPPTRKGGNPMIFFQMGPSG